MADDGWSTVGGSGRESARPPQHVAAAGAVRNNNGAAPPPCRFFQIGTCSAGAQCKFSHAKTNATVKSDDVCKFWQQGKCAHGSNCAFRHSSKGAVAAAAATAAGPTKKPGYIAPPPPPKPPQAQPAPPAWVPLSPREATSIASGDAAARRQQLGAQVYPRIVVLLGEALAKKLTGMLLTMPPPQLLTLLTSESPALFEAAIHKALAALPAEMLQSLTIGNGAPLGGGLRPSGAAAATAAAHASLTAPSPLLAPPGFAGAVPPAPRADPVSEQAVRSIVPTPAELARSSTLSCGVCLEQVLAKRGKFGLLEGCNHVFCDPCLRQWRSTHATRPDVARSCPECRAPSHFVVPAPIHVEGARKASLIKAYLSRLRAIPCKHFAFGEGTCPFGTSCFYAHTDREGKPIAAGQPRSAVGTAGATVLPNYLLSHYLFPETSVAVAGEALLASIPVVDPPRATDLGEGQRAAGGGNPPSGSAASFGLEPPSEIS